VVKLQEAAVVPAYAFPAKSLKAVLGTVTPTEVEYGKLAGSMVAVKPLADNTTLLRAMVCEVAPCVMVMEPVVALVTGSEKVNVKLLLTGTFVAPLAGERVAVGACVSGAAPVVKLQLLEVVPAYAFPAKSLKAVLGTATPTVVEYGKLAGSIVAVRPLADNTTLLSAMLCEVAPCVIVMEPVVALVTGSEKVNVKLLLTGTFVAPFTGESVAVGAWVSGAAPVVKLQEAAVVPAYAFPAKSLKAVLGTDTPTVVEYGKLAGSTVAVRPLADNVTLLRAMVWVVAP
jgi:hypothetical protein